MLLQLKIKNMAIIKNLELNFFDGLNVVTGETGAGKSMLIDALSLLSGQRASVDMIRDGEDFCEVQGVFSSNDIPELVNKKLIDNDINFGEELNIRRLMYKNGRSRLYVNDVVVTQGFLSSIGSMFISILSQHEHQKLFSSNSQLELLDKFIMIDDDVRKLANVYQRMLEKNKELQLTLQTQADYIKKADYLKYQLDELNSYDLKDDDEEVLTDFISKANSAVNILKTVSILKDVLNESDDAITPKFYRLIAELVKYQDIEKSFVNLSEKLNDAVIILEDIVAEAENISRCYDFDNELIQEQKEKLSEIKRLKKKFACVDINALLNYKEQINKELDNLENIDEKIHNLEKDLIKIKTEYQSKAKQISEIRKNKANLLSEKIESILESLGLFAGGFYIQFNEATESATGIDKIDFLISTNPGESAKPISKIASGGELSRLMLAVQASTNQVYGYGIQVYDEVDTGIGGDIAFKVGALLKKIASNHQLIVITHLPQIAVFSDFHVKLWKSELKGRTHVSIKELMQDQDKSEEIGRMLGTNSDIYAKEMQEKAKNILI